MFTIKKYEADGQRLGAKASCTCPQNFVGDVVKYRANQQMLGACGSCGGQTRESLSFSGNIESINFIGDVEKREIMVANSTFKSSDNVSDATGEASDDSVEANVQKIKKDVAVMKREGRLTNVIQIGAIALVFFFGIATLTDLKEKIK